MEVKESIRRYLAATPGASTMMVAAHLGLDASSADYHLRRLRRASAVTRETVGREVAWFNTGCGLCPLLRRATPVFRRPDVATVARTLEETPTTMRAISDRSSVELGRVRWIFEVLEEVGVAERSRTGRPKLVDGAELCVAKARSGEACALWGRCAPSKRESAAKNGERKTNNGDEERRTLT